MESEATEFAAATTNSNNYHNFNAEDSRTTSNDDIHNHPPLPREIDYDLLYSEEVDETGGSGPNGGNDDGKLFRSKNKRTVAAVSAADRSAALTAMEELRCRGATTDDLVCRLCVPPRPFTAYSTLLTHYRNGGASEWLSGGIFPQFFFLRDCSTNTCEFESGSNPNPGFCNKFLGKN